MRVIATSTQVENESTSTTTTTSAAAPRPSMPEGSRWAERWGWLLDRDALDLGYRLVVAEVADLAPHVRRRPPTRPVGRWGSQSGSW